MNALIQVKLRAEHQAMGAKPVLYETANREYRDGLNDQAAEDGGLGGKSLEDTSGMLSEQRQDI